MEVRQHQDSSLKRGCDCGAQCVVHNVASRRRSPLRCDPLCRDRRVLFMHTGGLLGMYDKEAQLGPLVTEMGRVERMPLEDEL